MINLEMIISGRIACLKSSFPEKLLYSLFGEIVFKFLIDLIVQYHRFDYNFRDEC